MTKHKTHPDGAILESYRTRRMAELEEQQLALSEITTCQKMAEGLPRHTDRAALLTKQIQDLVKNEKASIRTRLIELQAEINQLNDLLKVTE